MNSICTTIEQSKKLIELGIDVSTADMCYCPMMNIDSGKNEGYLEVPECYPFSDFKNFAVPYLAAWSLSALLKLMPIYIRINNEDYNFSLARGGAGAYTFSYTHSLKKPWELGYDLHLTTHKDSVIDAAFEMVCWLLENKKI